MIGGWLRKLFQGWLLRGVKDSLISNTNRDWPTVDSDPETTLGGQSARSTLRGRARSLEQDSEITRRALDVLENNVVGPGIRPEISTGNRKMDKAIEDAWELWAYDCDITGWSTFYELQRMVLRRVYVDGEIFANKVVRSDGLKLQLLEPEHLDSGYSSILQTDNGSTIVAGVEIDKYSRPLGYWFSSSASNPYSSNLLSSAERFDAKDVLHLYFKMRPQQVRGVSVFTSIIRRIRDVDEYMDAKVIAARIAACMAVFVTTPDPAARFAGTSVDEGDATKRVKTIKPGTVNYMRPGETINTAAPSGAESGSTDVLASQLRLVALGLNLSYELLSGDLSRVNFSSGRMGSMEDRKHFRRDQQWLVDHLCRPVFRAWLDTATLKGHVEIPDYWQNPDKYLSAVTWKCPGWAWVDPLKEINAHKEALKAGLTTLSEVCAVQGLDYAEVLEQLSKEKALADELGLTLDVFVPETVPEGGGDDGDDKGGGKSDEE